MRKAYSLPPHVMVVLFLVLLGTVVYFALSNKAMGKIAEYDPLESAAWSMCTDINDPNTKSVTFEGFMKAMKDVYDKCNGAENICGIKSCKSMTLDLGGAETYYDINLNVLSDRGLEVFNNYLSPNIFCNIDNVDWGDDEIDVYGNDKCIEMKSFSVAHGSKITIKATKRGSSYIIGSTVDLKITVTEGEFKTSKTTPLTNTCPKYPTKDPSNPDADCKPPDWGYCYSPDSNTGICKNKYYCRAKDPTPPNCHEIRTTCPVSYTFSEKDCNSQYETSCSGSSFTTKILRLTDIKSTSTGEPQLMVEFEASDGSVSGRFGVLVKNEIWLKKQNGKIVVTDENDKDAKLSLLASEIDEIIPTVYAKDWVPTYDVRLYQGCY